MIWNKEEKVTIKITPVDSRHFAEERFLAQSKPKFHRGQDPSKDPSKAPPRFRSMGKQIAINSPHTTKSSGVTTNLPTANIITLNMTLGTSVMTAMNLDPDWIARSLVAEFDTEGAPSFITKHEYQLEGDHEACVYAYKWQPVSFEYASTMSNTIKREGLRVQVPRDFVFTREQDNEIIASANRHMEDIAKGVALNPEEIDTLYWGRVLQEQRSLGHDEFHSKPMFQLVEYVKLQNCDILNDNSIFCSFPSGAPANIAYFPRILPDKESWNITVDLATGEKKAERAESSEHASILRLDKIRKLIKDENEKNTRDTAVEAAQMMKKGTQAIIQKKAWAEELINAKAFTKDMSSPEKRKAIELAKKMAPIVCECKIIFANFPTLTIVSRRTGRKVAQSNEVNLDLNEHMTIADLYTLINKKYSERFALLEDAKFATAEVTIHMKTETSENVRVYDEEAEELADIITTHLGPSPSILIAMDDGTESAKESIKIATRRITHPAETLPLEKKARPEQKPQEEAQEQTIAELQQQIADLQKQQEISQRSAKNKDVAMKKLHEKQMEKITSRLSTDPSLSLSQSLTPQGATQTSELELTDDLAACPATYYETVFRQALSTKAAKEAKEAKEKAKVTGGSPAKEDEEKSKAPATEDDEETPPNPITKLTSKTIPPKETPTGSPPKKPRGSGPPPKARNSPATNLSAKFMEVKVHASSAAPQPPQPLESQEEMDQQEDQAEIPSVSV